MPGAGREIVCKESLLAKKKKREKTMCSMYFLLSQLIPASPRNANSRRPLAVPASVSERGRSALFKNHLFLPCKFLDCYIEAAQNFFMYVRFLSQIGHKKITLLNWF
jgi:hypothetical protein